MTETETIIKQSSVTQTLINVIKVQQLIIAVNICNNNNNNLHIYDKTLCSTKNSVQLHNISVEICVI